MSIIEAIILGITQGLTEFLPISSSGHIELVKAILGTEIKDDVTFTVVVHGGTVLSTIVVFWKDIKKLLGDFFKFKSNESTHYIYKLAVSAIPVAIIGLKFKDEIEQLFFGNVLLVGFMLIITGALLTFTYFSREHNKNVSYGRAIIIGLAQAFALLPGISRSGSTIATSLLVGVKKEAATKFSFLMVLAPIIGANLKDVFSGELSQGGVEPLPLLIGFIAAFVSGLFACKWMIKIVNRGKLIYFAIYCFIVGTIAIVVTL
ncbi:undecaprenyl-diphosphate phosphatase [Fulvivirgaceae bacterium BMA10]|uniref:Undecaprenyl-diphosphatase n=1 Tax=Splendidivirga corallicola TaxID=3051826 RepID=A0ABT8KHS4_9BACT|nr:undecaprenyl-diphosphate phosphatase [Fulvivirgaceae bacterium BMA10]